MHIGTKEPNFPPDYNNRITSGFPVFSIPPTSHECMINHHKESCFTIIQTFPQAVSHPHTMSFNDLQLWSSLPFSLNCIAGQWSESTDSRRAWKIKHTCHVNQLIQIYLSWHFSCFQFWYIKSSKNKYVIGNWDTAHFFCSLPEADGIWSLYRDLNTAMISILTSGLKATTNKRMCTQTIMIKMPSYRQMNTKHCKHTHSLS